MRQFALLDTHCDNSQHAKVHKQNKAEIKKLKKD